MKVNDELYILELPMVFGGAVNTLSVSLIADAEHGLTLVDAGLPGQVGTIEEALKAEGFSVDQLKQIVLTHQDIDHVGSLHELKERTNATVYAYIDEVPYIDGTLPLIKMPSEERLAQMPEFAALLKHFKTTPVDVAFQDGETLGFAANAKVVATPGHTPGHVCLYLPSTKTLIAGDAVVAHDGVLQGPFEQATPDLDTAKASVKKLAELDVETVVCYHGGVIANDASSQLKRVADAG